MARCPVTQDDKSLCSAVYHKVAKVDGGLKLYGANQPITHTRARAHTHTVTVVA